MARKNKKPVRVGHIYGFALTWIAMALMLPLYKTWALITALVVSTLVGVTIWSIGEKKAQKAADEERKVQQAKAEAAAKAAPFAVALLDIYMPGINGVETAKALRAFDPACLLIFTTTSTDHALAGFQVRAMHYLVKPFTQEDVDQLTDEILARLPRMDKYMEINVNGGDIRLSYDNIVYAEHFAHMIHIHTPALKPLLTRMPFKDFIAPLREDGRFFVCGRGTIVNLAHAADFEDAAFVMDEGSRVLISRELTKAARQAFMEYLLQGRR